MDLRETFGDIDIYLFDQLLKGRIPLPASLLDAGCGDGRNLVYFLRNGFDVFGVDSTPRSVEYVRLLAARLAPGLPADNFIVSNVEKMPFADNRFDLVISSAVLHFAADEKQFDEMLTEMWRVLRPGGMLFARLASSIGIEGLVTPLGGRQFALPDGTTRFLVDEQMLAAAERRLGARRIEPLKTTNVQNLRCMTTWVTVKQ
jgi:SAM-dependent methyltransferase